MATYIRFLQCWSHPEVRWTKYPMFCMFSSKESDIVMLLGSQWTPIHFVKNYTLDWKLRSDVRWGPGAFIDIGTALTWRLSDMNRTRGDNGWCIHTCTTVQFWQFWRESFMVNMWISVCHNLVRHTLPSLIWWVIMSWRSAHSAAWSEWCRVRFRAGIFNCLFIFLSW